MEEEMRFHLSLDAMQSGLPSPADDRHARQRFGNVTMIREDRRRASGLSTLDRLRQDAVYARRQLLRAPGFTAAVVLTLALGVGANATMFALVDRLMLRPPAGVGDPDRVVEFRSVRALRSGFDSSSSFSFPSYVEFRGMTDVFDHVTAVRGPADVAVDLGSSASTARGSQVADQYFETLGVSPARGRFFSIEETREPVGRPVAVVSHEYWQSHWAGAANVVGQTIRLQGHPYTVIGVAPRGFGGHALDATDIWFPLAAAATVGGGRADWATQRGSRFYRVIARLRPGVAMQRAAARISTGWTAWNIRPERTNLEPARAYFASLIPARNTDRPEYRVATLLAAVSGLLLLITCANVANLLLARALTRRREIAVRLALGVSRGRLASLLLTDAVLLALLGGFGALLVAHWGTPLVRSVLLAGTVTTAWPIDGRLVLFTLAIAMIAGVLAGIVPAVQASRPSLLLTLRQGARAGTVHRSRTRMALLISQGALSVALLAGTGLFIRSLQRLGAQHLGLDLDKVVVADFAVNRTPYSTERVREVYREMQARARLLPGVESASLSVGVPFEGQYSFPLIIPGHDSIPGMERGHAPFLYAVTPEYLTTMGTRVLTGRGLSEADVGGPAVAVVNATMARLIWPRGNAIDQCFKIALRSPTADCIRVIGIAEDARRDGVLEATASPQYYIPLEQAPPPMTEIALLVRVHDPGRVRAALHAAVQGLRDDLPYVKVRSLRDVVAPELRPWRFGMAMFALFGGLALVVSALGTYSVMQFSVTQRTREIGIRMALGAGRADVMRMVTTEGVRLAAVAAAAGLVLALASGGAVAGLLFQTSPRDPVVLGTVVLVLLLAAVAATLTPAWRATRTDPIDALRAE